MKMCDTSRLHVCHEYKYLQKWFISVDSSVNLRYFLLKVVDLHKYIEMVRITAMLLLNQNSIFFKPLFCKQQVLLPKNITTD